MAEVRPGSPLSDEVESLEGIRRRQFSAKWLKRRLALITMFFGTTVALFWYFGAFGLARSIPTTPQQPQQPEKPHYPVDESLVVTLPGYGSFQGTQVATGLKQTDTLSKPVDGWLNVPYSTQPVGEDRLKPVTWPAAFDGVKDATTSGPACFQNMYGSLGQSEACLTLNIWRPSGLSADAQIPVLVFLHGGSFVSGSHRSFDGALFVGKSAQPVMVITVQYRLGALGSLPGKFMEEEGLLNLGIRDQKQALEFVQKYVTHFGGNPDQVTLAGQSAGGHSVGIHLFHNYGEDAGKPLFHRAMLSSGSPTARAFPGVDFALYQRQVEAFMDYMNCPTTPNEAALSCLRSAEVDDLQFISSSLYNANNYNITWPWQPVSPGPLLEKRGSTSGEDGSFFKIPILISSTSNEGTGFVPQDLRTNAEYLRFWTTLTPGLNAQDFEDLQTLYPEGDISVQLQSPTYVSLQYKRLSEAYGDYSYICPVQDTASRLASADVPVYKARFNTPNWAPAYMGVPHASDAPYFNGQSGTQYPEISDLYSSYWASFVVSGDPNTYAVPGAAVWETYSGAKDAKQLVVNPLENGGPVMELESAGIRVEQCQWWRDEQRAKRLNK